jgi:hypothetical protein
VPAPGRRCRFDLVGWAEYGYCASYSRFLWGLRLHLLCTLHGLPVGFAVTGATADERQTLLAILDTDPTLTGADRSGQTLIADKNYYGRGVRAHPRRGRVDLLRPPGGRSTPGRRRVLKPLRQVIESINDTFNGQLDLEQHRGHTPAGVRVRVAQHLLALAAAIWHNDRTGQPIKRSLLAYDH